MQREQYGRSRVEQHMPTQENACTMNVVSAKPLAWLSVIFSYICSPSMFVPHYECTAYTHKHKHATLAYSLARRLLYARGEPKRTCVVCIFLALALICEHTRVCICARMAPNRNHLNQRRLVALVIFWTLIRWKHSVHRGLLVRQQFQIILSSVYIYLHAKNLISAHTCANVLIPTEYLWLQNFLRWKHNKTEKLNINIRSKSSYAIDC